MCFSVRVTPMQSNIAGRSLAVLRPRRPNLISGPHDCSDVVSSPYGPRDLPLDYRSILLLSSNLFLNYF